MLAKDKKKKKKVTDATVIDEALLLRAVRDFFQEEKILQRQAINLANIRQLSLSFQNIWKIQYLQCLDKLEKLQLDNNIIEKIENLGHLVNLKWLDLSFNNISKIEGLDTLVNLTDLSLYNNHISVLEGLEKCTKLNVFSIGNNEIRTFQEFLNYFGKGPDKRIKFKYLQVLNVYGNKFTKKDGVKDPEYENHLISHLPNLRYLDYVFIDDQKRKAIREDDKFKAEDQSKYLMELRIEEEKEKDSLEEKRKKEAAKMHLIDNFADDLVQEEELDKLRKMHGMDEEIQKFSAKVKEIVEIIQKKIKQMNEQKLKDVHKFELSIRNRQEQAEEQTIAALEEFQHDQKASMKQMEQKNDRAFIREECDKLKTKINELNDKLLGIEIELAEDVEVSLKTFINVLSEASKGMEMFLSGETGQFKKIEDEMKQFGVKLDRITRQQVDAFVKMQNNAQNNGQQDPEYSNDPELNQLLQNRDNIPGIVGNVKDRLAEKKVKAEGQVVQELCHKQVDNYTKLFNERQYERNRKNISNIRDKVTALKASVDELLIQQDQQHD